jgi:hypothetical protein
MIPGHPSRFSKGGRARADEISHRPAGIGHFSHPDSVAVAATTPFPQPSTKRIPILVTNNLYREFRKEQARPMREGSPNKFPTAHPVSCSKSLFRNILAASPSFSILYPCPAIPCNRKSFGMSILEGREQKKLRYYICPSLQNPGGRSLTTPKARSSAIPALTIAPSSNRRPIRVTPCGTRRGGEKVGSG